jgi:hypothetical protein
VKDLKNLNCLLLDTRKVLLQIVESCIFLDDNINYLQPNEIITKEKIREVFKSGKKTKRNFTCKKYFEMYRLLLMIF